MSDTPRTEAEVNRQKCWSDDLVTIDANFACQLERELNAANAKIKRLEEAGDDLANHHLLVVTTYDKAKTHVADWRKAEEDKP